MFGFLSLLCIFLFLHAHTLGLFVLPAKANHTQRCDLTHISCLPSNACANIFSPSSFVCFALALILPVFLSSRCRWFSYLITRSTFLSFFTSLTPFSLLGQALYLFLSLTLIWPQELSSQHFISCSSVTAITPPKGGTPSVLLTAQKHQVNVTEYQCLTWNGRRDREKLKHALCNLVIIFLILCVMLVHRILRSSCPCRSWNNSLIANQN